MGIDLHLFQLMKHESLGQALLDRYSSPLCQQCSSLSTPSPCSDVSSTQAINLIVVTDDGLHPHIDELLQSLHDLATRSLLPASRNCILCNAPITCAIVRSVMSFDSMSVVPCRELFRQSIPDHQPLDSDTALKELLTRFSSLSFLSDIVSLQRLSARFDSHSFSTQSLLAPAGPSQVDLSLLTVHLPIGNTFEMDAKLFSEQFLLELSPV